MQVVLLHNQESLESKGDVRKYAFMKTKLHIYRGDAAAAISLQSSVAPTHEK